MAKDKKMDKEIQEKRRRYLSRRHLTALKIQRIFTKSKYSLQQHEKPLVKHQSYVK